MDYQSNRCRRGRGAVDQLIRHRRAGLEFRVQAASTARARRTKRAALMLARRGTACAEYW